MNALLKQISENYKYGTQVKSATGKVKKIFILSGKPYMGVNNTKDVYATSTESGMPVLLYDSETQIFAEIIA